jgi:hypothetical protein
MPCPPVCAYDGRLVVLRGESQGSAAKVDAGDGRLGCRGGPSWWSFAGTITWSPARYCLGAGSVAGPVPVGHEPGSPQTSFSSTGEVSDLGRYQTIVQ